MLGQRKERLGTKTKEGAFTGFYPPFSFEPTATAYFPWIAAPQPYRQIVLACHLTAGNRKVRHHTSTFFFQRFTGSAVIDPVFLKFECLQRRC